MTYSWKIPGIYKVTAQAAGEELNRIYNETGELEPAEVVRQSRPETAILHGEFEWDDPTAAEKYREVQAQCIIRSVVAVMDEKPDAEVRAFVHAKASYHPIEVAVADDELTAELLRDALAELKSFERKYRSLSELAEVFRAIGMLARKEVS